MPLKMQSFCSGKQAQLFPSDGKHPVHPEITRAGVFAVDAKITREEQTSTSSLMLYGAL